MKLPKFTIVLEGSPEDGGKLRLEDFMRGLRVIIDALKETEKRLTGNDRANIQYKIIHLSQNSPATLTVEPIVRIIPKEEKSVTPRTAINTFLSDLSLIKTRKRVPENLDYHGLQKYVEISDLKKTHISNIMIRNGHKRVNVDDKFRKNITQAIGKDEYEDGSLTGKLETINIHGKNKFYIYPILGAKKVQCIFPPEIKEQVKQALDERIEVEGVLRYKNWDKFPYAINVKNINIYPNDDKLSTFSELVGIAPNATNGIDPAIFIRNLRDEEW